MALLTWCYASPRLNHRRRILLPLLTLTVTANVLFIDGRGVLLRLLLLLLQLTLPHFPQCGVHCCYWTCSLSCWSRLRLLWQIIDQLVVFSDKTRGALLPSPYLPTIGCLQQFYVCILLVDATTGILIKFNKVWLNYNISIGNWWLLNDVHLSSIGRSIIFLLLNSSRSRLDHIIINGRMRVTNV